MNNTDSPDIPDQWLTMEEMANKLRISKPTLSRYCNEGLPNLKVSKRHVLFNEKAVYQWFESNKTNSSDDTDNFNYNYKNVLIAPLTDPNSIAWYKGKNKIKKGTRLYAPNDDGSKHVTHINYFAPIINGQIKNIELILQIENKNISSLGYNENQIKPVLILESGWTLNKPITADSSRHGPGFTLNCLDIMLHNQGQPLTKLTELRKKRERKYQI